MASIVAARLSSPGAWTVATIVVSLLVGDAIAHVPDLPRGGSAATLAAKSFPGDLVLPATLIVLRAFA